MQTGKLLFKKNIILILVGRNKNKLKYCTFSLKYIFYSTLMYCVARRLVTYTYYNIYLRFFDVPRI